MVTKFKKENPLMFWIILISVVFISLGLIFLDRDGNLVKPVAEPLTSDEIEWVRYENKKYSFELEYPKHWQIYEGDRGSHIINFYPFQDDLNTPLIHHDNYTHFSIYPNGVPTEGLIGENIEVGMTLFEEVKTAREYVLFDKSKWSTMVTFKDIPKSWDPWGFVWAGVKVENLDFSCRQGGDIISVDLCRPFEGDEILRSGSIDNEMLEILNKIMSSFKFIE